MLHPELPRQGSGADQQLSVAVRIPGSSIASPLFQDQSGASWYVDTTAWYGHGMAMECHTSFGWVNISSGGSRRIYQETWRLGTSWKEVIMYHMVCLVLAFFAWTYHVLSNLSWSVRSLRRGMDRADLLRLLSGSRGTRRCLVEIGMAGHQEGTKVIWNLDEWWATCDKLFGYW